MAVVVADRLYRGDRTKDRAAVTVILAPGESRPLAGQNGVCFDWGRPTDGALALARALVRDALGDEGTTEIENRLFHEVILKLPFVDPWVLWRHDVQELAGKLT
jgi:hypothetical protein